MSRLNNYLRMYRRRFGFSQQEVAFLLGCRFGDKVSRYERSTREPSLRNALACEIIFHAELKELFAGIYQQAERDTAKRATTLLQQLEGQDVSERKLAVLKAIADSSSDDLRWESILQP